MIKEVSNNYKDKTQRQKDKMTKRQNDKTKDKRKQKHNT
jgi:hypothetical protein